MTIGRTQFCAFAALLGVLFLLAACGDGGSEPGTSYPPAGEDRFDATSATIQIELSLAGASLGATTLQGLETVELRGPALIMRGDPQLGGDGRYFVETEIVSMELTGASSIGTIIVRQSPRNRSLGEVRQQQVGVDFPADSFFDVFVEIELVDLGMTAENAFDPLRLGATLSALPPAEGDEYRTRDTTPVGIQTVGEGRQIGRIVDALHIPRPPGAPAATATVEAAATATPPESGLPDTSGSCRRSDDISVLIISFTNLDPGQTLSGIVDGPAVLGEDTFEVTADENGDARYEVDIGMVGQYVWVAASFAGTFVVEAVCLE